LHHFCAGLGMVVAFQRVNGTGLVPGRQFTGKATRLQQLPGGFSFRIRSHSRVGCPTIRGARIIWDAER
jgi:hypothetical protein